MLESPLLLLIPLAACLAAIALLTAALVGARRKLDELERRPQPDGAPDRQARPSTGQIPLAGWITGDYLSFLRRIHGPIPVRQIVTVLTEFLNQTFDPDGTVVLIRRRPAVSEPGRERQLVVAAATRTRVRPGGVIALGEGDLGYVAQTRRAMDRRELDHTPSAGGDAGALGGFHPELAAPMAVGAKTLGVVGIGRPARPVPRGKELLDLVAHTAALALENALVLHQIRTAASADPLTGIYSKGALAHRLEELIESARERQHRVALLVFDVDHFTKYNENNGSEAGDELLRMLASLVSDEVRVDDVFGRLGGEQFLLILPGRTEAEAEKTAGKVLRLVRGHDFPGAGRQPLGLVTISAGVAVFPDHAEDSAGVLRVAEQALHRAKERGRDRVVVASELAAGPPPPHRRRRP